MGATTDVNLPTHAHTHTHTQFSPILHHLIGFGMMLAIGILVVEHENLNASIEMKEKNDVKQKYFYLHYGARSKVNIDRSTLFLEEINEWDRLMV